MVQNSMVAINKEIGPMNTYPWVGQMAIFVATVPAPFVGYLSDIYGRRNFLLLGSVLAFIGTLVSANVSTIPRLYGASIMTGAGACLHQLAVPAVCEIVPRKWRPFAIGSFAAGLAPAAAFGPIIAASIMVNHSWRVLYWIPFAINIIAFVLTFLFYHPMNQYVRLEGKKASQIVPHLDWAGGVLVVIGATLALLGTSFGLYQYPWDSAKTLSCLVVGLCMVFGTILYGFVMRHHLTLALFPNTVFAQYRQYTVFLWPILFCSLIYASTIGVWPEQVQLLYTQDPIKAGWYTSASPIAGIFFAPVYGLIYQRFARFSRWIITSLVFILTLLAACQAALSPTKPAGSLVLVCLMGIAYTGIVVGMTSYMQLVPHRWLGTAFQFDVFLRVIGSSAAALAYSLILKNKLTSLIPTNVALPLAEAGVPLGLIPAVIEALLAGDATAPVLGELTLQQVGVGVMGIKQSFVTCFRVIYYATIALGVPCIGFVVCGKSFENLLVEDVDVVIVEGCRISAKTDTGEGVVVKEGGPWL
ncbi:MFS general substrate transporter [Lepidopterella palustris CBS 459.81]|uniref:MFS general substrate transporter n=1 Tax=Lepidopterella palustris CBS 459.81 TaxID=1314670 RepID=A0A8E2J8K9_9PEZI|nr:MFS general substrate transporter [Lepidopterella palustris CBS 459.81]